MEKEGIQKVIQKEQVNQGNSLSTEDPRDFFTLDEQFR